jgi:hypothetical protein|tara:strand:- start:6236 stop:8011 length:1776 start_codon:yes stop_codon:yes gene_type:complete
MAYFNHAFNKTFVVGSVAGAGVATSALASGQLALVNGDAWTSVAAGGGAPLIPEGALAYLVQGSFYSKDSIGNNPGHGGYKESVKSKGINPRYITDLWRGNCSVASKATAKLCLASDCAPCGKTQFARIDVKGSPALRFLNHNAYAIGDSSNVCCVDGQEYLDPALVLAKMMEQLIGNGLAKDDVNYQAGNPLITPFVAEGDPDGVKTFNAIAAVGVGTGYAASSTALATTVSPAGGSGLTVKVDSITAAVVTVSLTAGGTGYTNGAQTNVATTSDGAGSGATINYTGSGNAITSPSLGNSGGSGYVVGEVLTVAGGSDGKVTVASIAATGAIKAVTVLNEGAGYSVGDTVTVVGGGNNGALTVASVSAGSIEVTETTAAGVVTTEYYTIAQAAGVAAAGNYVPSTDPNGSTKISACVTLQGAYVDTVFGNCSFDTRDHYNAEPVEIILSSLDETGNPCNDCGVASRTPGSMQQVQGEEVIRELIMSERYRQNPYNQGNADSARFREIQMSDELLAAVDRTATYRPYYLQHSVPRFNNPSGVFDNDQYVYKVYIKCDDGALKTSMEQMWESIHKWAEANFNMVPVRYNQYW